MGFWDDDNKKTIETLRSEIWSQRDQNYRLRISIKALEDNLYNLTNEVRTLQNLLQYRVASSEGSSSPDYEITLPGELRRWVPDPRDYLLKIPTVGGDRPTCTYQPEEKQIKKTKTKGK